MRLLQGRLQYRSGLRISRREELRRIAHKIYIDGTSDEDCMAATRGLPRRLWLLTCENIDDMLLHLTYIHKLFAPSDFRCNI